MTGQREKTVCFSCELLQ